MNRSTGLVLAVLLLGGCGRPNHRASVTVRLPPAKAATPAPGFSTAGLSLPAA